MADYCWSMNGEQFESDLDGVLDQYFSMDHEGLAPKKITVSRGEVVKHNASHYFNHVSRIIEYMGEEAYEECGEYCGDWPECVTNKQEEELSKSIKELIDYWASKHGHHPTFFSVINVCEVEVDVDEVMGDGFVDQYNIEQEAAQ